ncbi:MAG: hypothetical protein L6W00_14765 [Lentisphaeria bacterium]|nr:MAG: hypothetical protein L6W00_14765 [Lentisphaeria bacterium]
MSGTFHMTMLINKGMETLHLCASHEPFLLFESGDFLSLQISWAAFDPAGDFDFFFCQLCRLWKTSEIPPADAAFFPDRLYSDRSVDDFPGERSVLPPK